MALGTPSVKYSDVVDTPDNAAGSGATGNLALSDGDEVFVCVGTTTGSGGAVEINTPTSSPALTFTLVEYTDKGDNFSSEVATYRATVSTTQNYDITCTTDISYDIHVVVFTVTGVDTIGAANAELATSTTTAPTLTLDTAPASSSLVVGVAYEDSNADPAAGFGTGTGFTQASESLGDSGQYGAHHVQYRTGSTSTSVPWASSENDGFTLAAQAFEITEAAGGVEEGTATQNFSDSFSSTGTVNPNAFDASIETGSAGDPLPLPWEYFDDAIATTRHEYATASTIGSDGLATGNSNENYARFSRDVGSADMDITVRLKTLPGTAGAQFGVIARMASTGGDVDADVDGYMVMVEATDGTGGAEWKIREVTNASRTDLTSLATISGGLAVDDEITVRVEGTTITALLNGSELGSTTDATITGGDCGGIYAYDAGVDNEWTWDRYEQSVFSNPSTATQSFSDGSDSATGTRQVEATTTQDLGSLGSGTGERQVDAVASQSFSGAFSATGTRQVEGTDVINVGDDFNRADEEVSANANWEDADATGNKIVSNQVTNDKTGTFDQADRWIGDEFEDDQWAEVDVVAVGDEVSLILRSTGVGNYYVLAWIPDNGGSVEIYSAISSSWAYLGTTTAGVGTSGRLKFTATTNGANTDLVGYVDGVQEISVTDTTTDWASGYPGIQQWSTATNYGTLDNFNAGPVVGIDTFGGTFAGTGTVLSGETGTATQSFSDGNDTGTGTKQIEATAAAQSFSDGSDSATGTRQVESTVASQGFGSLGSAVGTKPVPGKGSQTFGGRHVAADDFNRSDGGLGGNWTVSTPAPQIVSNAVPGTNDTNGVSAIWTADTFAADQWVEADFRVTTAHIDNNVWLLLRLDGGTGDGYFASYPRQTDGAAAIGKLVGSVFDSELASTSMGTPALTHVRFTVNDDTLTLFADGVQVLTATDSSFTSGSPGFVAQVDTGALEVDNFSAGDLHAFAATGTAQVEATAASQGFGSLGSGIGMRQSEDTTSSQNFFGTFSATGTVTSGSIITGNGTQNFSDSFAGTGKRQAEATATQDFGSLGSSTSIRQVEATATSQAFGFTGDGTGTLQGEGTAAQNFSGAFDAPSTLATTTGTATQSFDSLGPGTGTRNVEATATQNFSDAFSATGTVQGRVTGTADQTIGSLGSATGSVNTTGVVDQNFGGLFAVDSTLRGTTGNATQGLGSLGSITGQRQAEATAAQSFSDGNDTSTSLRNTTSDGSQNFFGTFHGTGAVNGQSLGVGVQSFGSLGTGTGTRSVEAAADQSLGSLGSGTGTRSTTTAAIQGFGSVGSATGTKQAETTNANQGFGSLGSVNGTRQTSATATQSFGSLGSATGSSGAPGSGTQSFSGLGAATGERSVEAVSVSGFGGVTNAAGIAKRSGIATSTINTSFLIDGDRVLETLTALTGFGGSLTASGIRLSVGSGTQTVMVTATAAETPSVWNVGTPAGVYHIHGEQYSALNMVMILSDSSGTINDLSGYSADLSIRDRIDGTVAAVSVSTGSGHIVLLSGGRIQISIPSSVMSTLSDNSVYRLNITSGSGIVERVLSGKFFVEHSSTVLTLV